MSWHTLVNIAEGVPAAVGAPAAAGWVTSWAGTHPTVQRSTSRAPLALGSAQAAARWSWAEPNVAPLGPGASGQRDLVGSAVEEARRVRVGRDLVSLMAEAARASGRSEDDIWNEAAREWLMRHARNDEPPPTTPAAAAIPRPRPPRSWAAVDAVLVQLRDPHATPIAEPAA